MAVMTIVLVPAVCAVVVTQVNTPLAGLSKTPAGAELVAKVNVVPGEKMLVAELVMFSVWPAKNVCVDGTVKTGVHGFTTTTVKLLVALKEGVLLSATLTVMVFVPDGCVKVVTHVTTPFVGFRFRLVRVAGGETKVNNGVPLVG